MMNKEVIKKTALLLGCTVLSVAIILAGQVFGIFLISFLTGLLQRGANMPLTPAWVTAAQYLICIGMWIVAIIVMIVWKNNRFLLDKLGRKNNGNTYMSLLVGAALGFFMNFICILVALLNHDIELKFVGFFPISFIGIFICVLIQSSAEEFMCRGFLYQKAMEYFHKPVVAILLNTLLFTVLHLANPGITALSVLNIFLSGLMFSLILYYTDSLWCVFAAHTTWNFTQNILFGLPNSGLKTPYSVFALNADTARNSFAYNVDFGIEGTIVADLVLLLGCICVYLWGRNRNKNKSISC